MLLVAVVDPLVVAAVVLPVAAVVLPVVVVLPGAVPEVVLRSSS